MGGEYNEELIAGAHVKTCYVLNHWNKGFIEHTGMQAEDVDVVQIPEPPPHAAMLSSKRKHARRRNTRKGDSETKIPKGF